jgi:fatty acid desaturase
MRFTLAMLAAVPLASAFAPCAGFNLAKVGAPAVAHPRPAALSARRPARLLDLKATAAAPPVVAESEYTVPEWRKKVDLKAWANEVRAVEKKYRQAQGEEDVKHMKKMLNWTYVLYAIGLATAGFATFPFNPISALCLSTAICMRWTMIGHHVCHGGYNAEVGIGNRFHRATFARGPVRRFMDWCDWMLPEAWDVEHNYMHHYELGEGSDPDLLERNAHNVRISKMPKALKYVEMMALMVMWKWFYYAPNTVKELYDRQIKLAEKKGDFSITQPFDMPKAPGDFGDVTKAATVKHVFSEMFKGNFLPAKVMFGVLSPYFTAHFVITPLIFYALFGQAVAMTALVNLFAAEVLTNIHSFIIVVPNHAGEDVYRFKTPVKVKTDDFYLRAVIGSANFRTGGNVNDFMHGWLNYQIEHHMFADMSMLSYQRMAPEIKAICEKHGVPYVQENVFTRLRKTLQIGVGSRDMLVYEHGDAKPWMNALKPASA